MILEVQADWIYQVLSSGVKVNSHETLINKGFVGYLGDLGKVCIGEICWLIVMLDSKCGCCDYVFWDQKCEH